MNEYRINVTRAEMRFFLKSKTLRNLRKLKLKHLLDYGKTLVRASLRPRASFRPKARFRPTAILSQEQGLVMKAKQLVQR